MDTDNFHSKYSWNWCTKVLSEVDIYFVIGNLLKEDFVVEINEHKYDISFKKNKNSNEICFSNGVAPSPPLCGFEIINEGFTKGKWYVVTGKNLSKEEKEKIAKGIEVKEQLESEEAMKELIKKVEKLRKVKLGHRALR